MYSTDEAEPSRGERGRGKEDWNAKNGRKFCNFAIDGELQCQWRERSESKEHVPTTFVARRTRRYGYEK